MQRDLIIFDAETYWAADYSLSKMTAIEYVYDQRFELILFSVKRNDEPTVWFSGTWQESIDFLKKYKLEDCIVAGHNMSEFDSLILGKMGFVPYRYVCTLQLARLQGLQDAAGGSLKALARHFGLKPKGDEVERTIGLRRADFTPAHLQAYGEYCVHDTDLCYELLHILMPGVPPVEFVIMDCLTKFSARPLLKLDVPLLEKYALTLADRMEEVLSELGVTRDDLTKNERMANLLRALGVDPPMKPNGKGDKLIYAFAKTDIGMQELLNSDDERVATLAAARLGAKSNIEETRTKRFLDTFRLMGAMPMPQRYHGAHTGRGSGTMLLNMLNLSSRNREPVLKKSLLAPEGYEVAAADSSQIEARLNAWNANQDDQIELWAKEREEMLALIARKAPAEEFAALKKKYDIYRDFASESIYFIHRDAVTDEQRTIAKSAVLGAGYMMGAKRFQDYVRTQTGLRISLEEAQDVINKYRGRFSQISNFWSVGKIILQGLVHGESYVFGRNNWLRSDAAQQCIRLPSGRLLRYRGLKTIDTEKGPAFVYMRRQGRGGDRMVFVHPGLFTENLIQAIARDVVMWQLALISKRYPVVSSTYDENVYVYPIAEREEALDYGRTCMLRVPSWLEGFPINCEIGYGASYGAA